MTVVLSTRQQLARNLANELGKFEDTWIVSPMPLDDSRKLRVQIADRSRNEMIQILKDWGYEAQFVSVLPRVCPTGLLAACTYEIDLPHERIPVVDDRQIHGEVARPEKTSVEMEAMRRYFGLQEVKRK
jgi:hypothetical protein